MYQLKIKQMIKNLKKESVIAVGNFDGFHLGHKKIVEMLDFISKEKGFCSTILTFIPNPKSFLNKKTGLISTDEQKERILKSLKVDRVLFIDFKEIYKLSGEDFVENYLIKKFNMKYIVVGENFRFGKNRECNVNSLKELSLKFGYGIKILEHEIMDGIKISSSVIREKLFKGEIEDANKMLGKEYYIDGTVIKGKRIGRELGFPTINIKPRNSILPEGVFKTRVKIDNSIYNSITNIGFRPTFYGEEKIVESHILGFNKIIYNKRVRIFFVRKIRNEHKFDSEESLAKQIEKDIKNLKVDKHRVF